MRQISRKFLIISLFVWSCNVIALELLVLYEHGLSYILRDTHDGHNSWNYFNLNREWLGSVTLSNVFLNLENRLDIIVSSSDNNRQYSFSVRGVRYNSQQSEFQPVLRNINALSDYLNSHILTRANQTELYRRYMDEDLELKDLIAQLRHLATQMQQYQAPYYVNPLNSLSFN